MSRRFLGSLGTSLTLLIVLAAPGLRKRESRAKSCRFAISTAEAVLLFRFNPPDFAKYERTQLPPDPKRDTFYNGTRWADNSIVTPPNLLCHGGLYGLPLPTNCVQSERPYFFGYTGRSSYNSTCCQPPRPVHRLVENFIHPFRPVGMYYAGGSYVPIYDLDPLVTGPGPFPWPVFLKRPLGG